MEHLYVGIDNGKSGAVAALDEAGAVVGLWPTPLRRGSSDYRWDYDLEAMVALLRSGIVSVSRLGGDSSLLVVIEQGHAFPLRLGPNASGFSSAQANFQNGYSMGLWVGMLTALRIPFRIVPARVWQAEMLGKIPKGTSKEASVRVAGERWPGRSLTRTRLSKKPDHGISDALLMAAYAYDYVEPGLFRSAVTFSS